jgi:hypothetical protein
LATPVYFNNDIGMPQIVSKYESSGYFDRFKPIYSGVNDTITVQNIMEWSKTCFNNMYGSRFTPTLNPTIMGSFDNIFSISMRPEALNMLLASKYILITQNGNCGESSLASIGMAQAAGIPVRQVGFRGEDHAFTEMLVDGEWMTLDPISGYGNGFNVPPRYYDTFWQNISYVEAIYPNGTVEDITSRYTDMGVFLVTVVDQNNQTVSNASVSVISYNKADHQPRSTNLTKTTGENSQANLVLGDGAYKITATNSTLTGSSNEIMLNPNETKNVTVVITSNVQTNALATAITDNRDLLRIFWLMFSVIVGLCIMLLVKLYNNRFLKVAVYGFFTYFFIGLILTLLRIFIVY